MESSTKFKVMEKKALFQKWFDNFNSKPCTASKPFGEFTISEKEDYLITNYPDLVPASSTKINAVTKLTASANVPFDIITKIAKGQGIADNEMFTWWANCIKKEVTFDFEVAVEYGKASQKARVAYLQKLSGISESKEVQVPILGGVTFWEFVMFSYDAIKLAKERAEKAAEEENKETEIAE